MKAGYGWLHFHRTDKQNQWKLAMITKFNFMFLSAFICRFSMMETRLTRRHKSVNIPLGDYLDHVD